MNPNRKRWQLIVAIVVAIIVIVVAVFAIWGEQVGQAIFFAKVERELGEPLSCNNIASLSMRSEPGPGYPGTAGVERWGIPEASPDTIRVRRSWSTLSDEEKQQYIDGILLMKMTRVGSGMPGAERADYSSLCPNGQTYPRSLMDYYVELHVSAFATMGGSPHNMMAHGAPHFLPWHRYLIARFEADMQTVLGDPTFALPYWDWDDCSPGTGDGSNPCPALFEENFLGSHGGPATDDEVIGYLVDQGYEINVWSEGDLYSGFNTDQVVCGSRPLRRAAGMQEALPKELWYQVPSSTKTIKGMASIPFYDAEPYDKCSTDETQSLRMYLEGHLPGADLPCYIDGRCARHGLAHVYIGGDMENGGTPNDPIFFLLHANVDRLWAIWQDNNLQNADTAIDYGNPGFPAMWRGPLFNFPEVMVDEMFDFRALGYEYDTAQRN